MNQVVDRKALKAALQQIEKQFGKGSIMRLGDVGRAGTEPRSFQQDHLASTLRWA
jgi:RecA/RadA recombinase